MIKLTDIGVSYGKNTVYDKFSFNFGQGVNVVLGKSGCGKTTLLNVIGGLIKYDGTCQKEGDVAFVFQQPCLAPVSVWKNLDLVLPKGNNMPQIEKVLAEMELSDKKDSPALSLSGGEQQRVELARAFVTNRKIMLLDEPFSGLDYGVKVQLWQLFVKQAALYQKTVVLVTHDIDEALALADRIYLLGGKPCTISKVAVNRPQDQRDEFCESTLVLKKQLQELLK